MKEKLKDLLSNPLMYFLIPIIIGITHLLLGYNVTGTIIFCLGLFSYPVILIGILFYRWLSKYL